MPLEQCTYHVRHTVRLQATIGNQFLQVVHVLAKGLLAALDAVIQGGALHSDAAHVSDAGLANGGENHAILGLVSLIIGHLLLFSLLDIGVFALATKDGLSAAGDSSITSGVKRQTQGVLDVDNVLQLVHDVVSIAIDHPASTQFLEMLKTARSVSKELTIHLCKGASLPQGSFL